MLPATPPCVACSTAACRSVVRISPHWLTCLSSHTSQRQHRFVEGGFCVRRCMKLHGFVYTAAPGQVLIPRKKVDINYMGQPLLCKKRQTTPPHTPPNKTSLAAGAPRTPHPSTIQKNTLIQETSPRRPRKKSEKHTRTLRAAMSSAVLASSASSSCRVYASPSPSSSCGFEVESHTNNSEEFILRTHDGDTVQPALCTTVSPLPSSSCGQCGGGFPHCFRKQ